MKQMRIENKELGDLLSEIRRSGFDEKHIRDTDTWRLYTRGGNDVFDVMYLSDHCEVILTQTFSTSESQKFEASVLEDLMKEYKGKYDSSVLKMYKIKEESFLGVYGILMGAIIGFITPARIFGAIVFGVAGYIAGNTIKNWQIRKERKKLDEYLSNNDIYIGEQVLEKLKSDDAELR